MKTGQQTNLKNGNCVLIYCFVINSNLTKISTHISCEFKIFQIFFHQEMFQIRKLPDDNYVYTLREAAKKCHHILFSIKLFDNCWRKVAKEFCNIRIRLPMKKPQSFSTSLPAQCPFSVFHSSRFFTVFENEPKRSHLNFWWFMRHFLVFFKHSVNLLFSDSRSLLISACV